MILRSLAVALATTAIPLAVHAQDPRPSTGGAMGTGAGAAEEAAPGMTGQPRVTGPSGGTGTGMDPDGSDSTLQQQRQTTGATGRTSPSQAAGAGRQTSGPFVTIPDTGAWRLADFEGTAVYGAEGEHIGEINDVLVSPEGEVEAVIIGVGGFLGIGEKDVAVAMNALEFGPGDGVRRGAAGTGTMSTGTTGTATTATGTADGRGFTAAPNVGAAGGVAVEAQRNRARDPAVTGQAAQQPGAVAPVMGEDGLPNRVILSVTRDQLEDAPAFEGVRSPYEQG